MKTSTPVIIDIDGWEIEVDVYFEYTPIKGYPSTHWEPGVPDEIEDIEIEESTTIGNIAREIQSICDSEDVKISVNYRDVLEKIQKTLNEDDILHSKLLDEATENFNSDYGDYLYEQEKDRRCGL